MTYCYLKWCLFFQSPSARTTWAIRYFGSQKYADCEFIYLEGLSWRADAKEVCHQDEGFNECGYEVR